MRSPTTTKTIAMFMKIELGGSPPAVKAASLASILTVDCTTTIDGQLTGSEPREPPRAMRTPEEWSSEDDARAYKELRALVDRWRRLGQKPYPDGTEWIGHTPHRAPQAYLHQLYAPLGAIGIAQMESELSCQLPDNFRCFLMLHNGIGLFASYINLYGLRSSWSRTNLVEAGQQPFSIMEPNVKRRPISASDDILFVGSLGHNRDLIGMNLDGRVFQWVSNSTLSGSTKSYSSVFTFLLEEAIKTEALFDPHGRERDSYN